MGKYLDLEGLGYLCGKIKTVLDSKQNRLSGQPGQLVGFCGNGISAIDITAGNSVKLAQLDSGLEIGVDLDNGTVTGDTVLLDGMMKPGTYNWLDTAGSMGVKGGLWNVVVTKSNYAQHESVVQALFGTYGIGTKGRVLVRAFYYANNPNWTPWRELASLDQVTNHNLLDNWYFLEPINQRGQTEYTTSGYTIDRWKMTGAGSVKVQDNGVQIQKAEGTPNITFETRIEDFRVPAYETVTISAVVNGTLITASGKIGSGISASSFTSNSLDRIAAYDTGSIPGVHIIRFVIVSEEPYLIKATKLELGSAQTLARQDTEGKWVLNDPPPNQAMELLKCQRYYQVFTSQDLRPIKAADFRPVMRANPALGTLVLDGETYYTADANL